MSRRASAFALVAAGMGVLVACAENNPPPANAPQPVVPGTQAVAGVTEEQAVADEDVVSRLANARCDRSQSCGRIGPGAHFRDRYDCMQREANMVREDLNAAKCPGGIGATGLSQCIRSIDEGRCDTPGQEWGRPSHCKLNTLCMKAAVK
jgi:Family of unknown function (DUF6184)